MLRNWSSSSSAYGSKGPAAALTAADGVEPLTPWPSFFFCNNEKKRKTCNEIQNVHIPFSVYKHSFRASNKLHPLLATKWRTLSFGMNKNPSQNRQQRLIERVRKERERGLSALTRPPLKMHIKLGNDEKHGD